MFGYLSSRVDCIISALRDYHLYRLIILTEPETADDKLIDLAGELICCFSYVSDTSAILAFFFGRRIKKLSTWQAQASYESNFHYYPATEPIAL